MTTSSGDRERSRQSADSPEDALSAARHYARPGKGAQPEERAAALPENRMGHTPGPQPSGAPAALGVSSPPSKAARTLAIVGIALWFFPCTLGCVASIVLGVISQRKAAITGESDILAKIAWIGGAIFTVAEVLVFFMYRSQGTR